MFLLVFALPEEARVVRKRTRWMQRTKEISKGIFAGREIAIQFIGIGGTAIRKLDQTIHQLTPDLVISSGFSGSTRSLLEPGDFVLASNYTDPGMAARLVLQKVADAAGLFAGVTKVAGVTDKWALNRLGSSIAVDMESKAIAEVCQRTNTPLITVRMISDGINETIPSVFIRKKLPRVAEVGEAVRFVVRMLRLTGKLADRLEEVVRSVPHGR